MAGSRDIKRGKTDAIQNLHPVVLKKRGGCFFKTNRLIFELTLVILLLLCYGIR